MENNEFKNQNILMNIIMFIFSALLFTILMLCAKIDYNDMIISGIIFAIIFPKNIKFYNK